MYAPSAAHELLFIETSSFLLAPFYLGKVTLTDCKSKFGTQVNGEKVLANCEVQLHHNDVIRFGHGPKDSTSVFR